MKFLILVANPAVDVEGIGHTDWIESNEYNVRRSRARAESGKHFLSARGGAADRVATAWFGNAALGRHPACSVAITRAS